MQLTPIRQLALAGGLHQVFQAIQITTGGRTGTTMAVRQHHCKGGATTKHSNGGWITLAIVGGQEMVREIAVSPCLVHKGCVIGNATFLYWNPGHPLAPPCSPRTRRISLALPKNSPKTHDKCKSVHNLEPMPVEKASSARKELPGPHMLVQFSELPNFSMPNKAHIIVCRPTALAQAHFPEDTSMPQLQKCV